MRGWLTCVVIWGTPVLMGAEEGAGGQETDADRLLRAELLEVSSGELDKAMAVYRSLIEEESTAASIKARAHLYLARCHRKRGELERAKKILESLVKTHPEERDIVRRAKSFLRELSVGEAENPRFDWIGELQRNPEIQARIFDSVMDLVDSGEKARSAGRQLLALGLVALPMLEQAIGNSRDPLHRRRLALLLLHLGKFEHLRAAFPPGNDYWEVYEPLVESFVRSLPALESSEKAKLRKALAEQPEVAKAGGIRDLLGLALGERTEIAARLATIEGRSAVDRLRPPRREDYGRADVLEVIAEEKQVCVAMAERILDPSSREDAQREFLRLVERHAPELLEAQHYAAVMGSLARQHHSIQDEYFLELEKRDGLELIAESPQAEKILRAALTFFAERYDKPERLRQAPATWAPVLRRAGSSRGSGRGTTDTGFTYLRHLAQVNDGAIGEFADWLRSPEFHTEHLWAHEEWTPSAAFARAMAELLDAEDPHLLAVALEAASIAAVEGTPDVTAKIARLVQEPPDLHVREFALCALLRRFAGRPQTGPEVAKTLLADFQSWNRHELPPAYFASPLNGHWDLGTVHRRSGKRITSTTRRGTLWGLAKGTEAWSSECLGWILAEVGEKVLLELHPHILRQTASEAGQGLYNRLFTTVSEKAWIERLVNDVVAGASESNEVLVYALARLKEKQKPLRDLLARGALPAGFAEFMRRVAVQPEREVPLEPRRFAVSLFAGVENQDSRDWFQWPKFLTSKDPLVPTLDDYVDAALDPDGEYHDRHSEEERRALLEAGLESPWSDIRSTAVRWIRHVINRPVDQLARLEVAAADATPSVREAVFDEACKLATATEESGLREKSLELAARMIQDKSRETPVPYRFRSDGAPDSWSRSERATLAEAALESRWEPWRSCALSHSGFYESLDDLPGALDKAVRDRIRSVRERARMLLLDTTDVRAAPVIVRLLDDPEMKKSSGLNCIQALERLASQESVEALVRLTNDNDASIRDQAIAALQKIRATLEQKQEWDRLLRDLRPAPDPSQGKPRKEP